MTPPIEEFCRIIEANFSLGEQTALRALAVDLQSTVTLGEVEQAHTRPYDWGTDGMEDQNAQD